MTKKVNERNEGNVDTWTEQVKAKGAVDIYRESNGGKSVVDIERERTINKQGNKELGRQTEKVKERIN